MAAMRVFICAVSMLAVASCDSKPNAGFEQTARDRMTADEDDPYSMLDSQGMPQPARYAQRPPEQRLAYVSGLAGSYRATYDNLLRRLDRDEAVSRDGALFARCRPAFAQASAYQVAAAKGASPPEAERTQIIEITRKKK